MNVNRTQEKKDVSLLYGTVHNGAVIITISKEKRKHSHDLIEREIYLKIVKISRYSC